MHAPHTTAWSTPATTRAAPATAPTHPAERPRGRSAGAVLPSLVVAVAVALTIGAVSGAHQAGPALPDTVMLFVAVPTGVPIDYGLADAARHEAGNAIGWLEAQVGEELHRGPDFAEVVTLAVPPDGLRGDADLAYHHILGQVTAHVGDEAVFPVILADLRTDADDATLLTCGMGGPFGVVMYLRNCQDRYISTASSWGSAASLTIAHELLHGMGAVGACAPNGTADGHVDDDPADVLHVRRNAWTRTTAVTLDAGHDDYFGHGIPGCPDIADSPLWG